MSNRQLIQKADLALDEIRDGGGLLEPAKAKQFIKEMIQSSDLMKKVTVTPMDAPKQRIPRIGLNKRIMRRGTSATALNNEADRTNPDFGFVELDAQLLKGEIRIPDEIVEDNIQRGTFPALVTSMARERVSADLEELVINGDVDSADDYLATLDGILKQATLHVVDFGGDRVNRQNLTLMHRAIPKPYRRLKSKMEFLTSDNAEEDFRLLFEDRETDAADKQQSDAVSIKHHGTVITPVGLWPEDLGVGEDETKVLLTVPKNIVVGFWRNIRFEVDRNVRAGYISIVITCRMDVKFSDPNAVVVGDNVLNQGFA